MKNVMVIAPGLGAHPVFYESLASRADSHGWDVCILDYPSLGVGFTPFELTMDVAKTLQDEVSGFDHVVFVGHSLGAIIGRELVYNNLLVPDAMVSICGPHKGYRSVWRPFLKHLEPFSSLAAQSDYFAVLNRLVWNPKVEALNIVATRDLVLSNESQRFGDFEAIEVPCGHLSAIYTPRVFWELWAWLSYTVKVGI